jgi:hypothetical protein
MDCSATIFVDEFSSILNTFYRFAGARSPSMFVIFDGHSTGLET